MFESDKPPSSILLFPIHASISRDEIDGMPFYRTTFSKFYENAEGGFSSTCTFAPEDMLLVAKAADLAHTEIEKFRAKDRRTN